MVWKIQSSNAEAWIQPKQLGPHIISEKKWGENNGFNNLC
jgi:hypothetical protein